MIRKIAVAATATVAALVTVTACSAKYTEQYKDSGRSGSNTDPALTIDMPDGFSNLATKCVGDIRYTVVFHQDNTYGAVSTVVDPACKGN